MLRFVFIALIASCASVVGAQSSGAAGGRFSNLYTEGPPPDASTIDRFITLVGTAEMRVVPTSLRVVFAVIAEAETGPACLELMEQRVATLTAAVENEGISSNDIARDTIALLPVYSWEVVEQGGRKIAVEKKTGQILQHNLHVEVKDEARAQAVIARALAAGFGDVIAVDHWYAELETIRAECQKKALAEAQRKAALLLDGLFKVRPPLINVHEETTVRSPGDLYLSFENAYVSRIATHYEDRLPQISAIRPKNTYLKGSFSSFDVRPKHLPMKPEISVISTIRLYFGSPAAEAKPVSVPK